MKKIIYECGLPGTSSGGLGDRLLGIASALSLCDVLECGLVIKWDDSNLSDYFNLGEKNFYSDPFMIENYSSFRKYSNHDVFDLGRVFSTSDENIFSDCDFLVFDTNQNIWQFLFDNKNYNLSDNYEDYTKKLYGRIFSEVLVPNDFLENSVIDRIGDGSNFIGVQIRMGDVLMSSRIDFNWPPQMDHFPLSKNPDSVVKLLGEILEKEYHKHIFLTSDFNLDIERILSKDQLSKIKYPNRSPMHIQRSNDKSKISETFIDFLCLSRCSDIYITYESNFGRIPSIMSPSKKINTIEKKNVGNICSFADFDLLTKDKKMENSISIFNENHSIDLGNSLVE